MPELTADWTVKETIITDLLLFINNKKNQIASIDKQIELLNTRKEQILTDLESLIPTE